MHAVTQGVTIHRRVEWADTDASGHYHNAAVVRWVEAAEAELHERLGIVSMTFGQTPRVHFEADFSLRLVFMDEVAVELSVVRVGPSSARYSFVIRRGETQAVAGWYVVAYVPRGSTTAQSWPDAVRSALTAVSRERPAE